MDDHKLRVFCTVAECRSFSKASEIIHLTQPAVSLQIQALEETYETKLFDRTGGAVTLTEAGERLYKYAKEILNLYAAAEQDINRLTGLVKGTLSIGASSTIGNYLMPGVLVDFRQRYPRIRVNLLIGNTRQTVERLEAGDIDVGLVEGEVNKHKLLKEKLLEDELVLVMAPDHPWANRKNISVSELASEPMIIREEGSGTRQIIEKHMQKHNMQLRRGKISMVLGSSEAIKAAVESGQGVSILSRWVVRKEIKFGTLKASTFKDIRFTRDFTIIRPRRSFNTHTVNEFLSFLKVYPFEERI